MGTIDPDMGLILEDKAPLTDEEKKTLYERAVTAADNGNFQYAYGLFSRLATLGYSDSADKAASARQKAYASPIIAVTPECFPDLTDVADVSRIGFLYADEQGIPRYVYSAKDGDNEVVNVYTPDEQLKGVTSFYSTRWYYHSLILALKEDGTVRVFYVKGREVGAECYSDLGICSHCMTISSQEDIDALVEELNNKKNVVRIVDGDAGYMDFAILCSDGTARYYSKALGSDGTERIASSDAESVIDIAYAVFAPDIWVLFSDGRIAEENDSARPWCTFSYFTDKTGISALIDEGAIINGSLYYLFGVHPPIDAKILYVPDVIFATQFDGGAQTYVISSGGKISDLNGNEIADATKLSYFCHSNITAAPVVSVDTNGKVVDVQHVFSTNDTDYSEQPWYKALLTELESITVRVK